MSWGSQIFNGASNAVSSAANNNGLGSMPRVGGTMGQFGQGFMNAANAAGNFGQKAGNLASNTWQTEARRGLGASTYNAANPGSISTRNPLGTNPNAWGAAAGDAVAGGLGLPAIMTGTLWNNYQKKMQVNKDRARYDAMAARNRGNANAGVAGLNGSAPDAATGADVSRTLAAYAQQRAQMQAQMQQDMTQMYMPWMSLLGQTGGLQALGSSYGGPGGTDNSSMGNYYQSYNGGR